MEKLAMKQYAQNIAKVMCSSLLLRIIDMNYNKAIVDIIIIFISNIITLCLITG